MHPPAMAMQAGDLLYGAGLEVRNVAAVHESPPNLNGTAPCDLVRFLFLYRPEALSRIHPKPRSFEAAFISG